MHELLLDVVFFEAEAWTLKIAVAAPSSLSVEGGKKTNRKTRAEFAEHVTSMP